MSEDPRLGKPSASGIYKLVSCPGSLAAEKDLPELPAESFTQEGTDIHAAAETGDTSELEGDSVDIAKRLKALEESTRDAWFNERPGGEVQRFAEVRLWMRDRKTLELLVSAQLDVLYVEGEHCLIVDFKTGYLDAPPADRNWQLLCQAICVAHEHPGVKTFRVAIAASRLSSKLDVAEYTLEDLQHAERELLHVLWLAKQPDAQRRPSMCCRYCKAKGICPEAASFSLVTQQKLGITSADKLAILAAVNSLTPQQMAHVWQRGKIATMILDGVEAKLKSITPEQLAEVRLMLKPGAVQKKITNNFAAHDRCESVFNPNELISCSKISVTELANLYATKNNVSKVQAKEAVLSLLGDAVEQTQNAPSLAVMK